MSVGHSTKVMLVFSAVVVLVAGGAVYFGLSTEPSPYPIPVANISVSLPPGAPYRQLTTGNWDDRYPAWSPNGSLIAFESDRNGSWAIMVMKADGTRVRALSAPGVISMYPTWSPDCSSVSYWSYSGVSSDFNVVRLADGRSSVVQDNGYAALPGPAQWSPDGSELLFFRTAGVAQLVLSDLQSGSLKVLANVSGGSLSSAWLSNTALLYTSASGNATSTYQLDLASGSGTPFLASDGSNFVTPSVGFGSTVAYFTDFKPDVLSTSPYVSYGYGYNVWVRSVANSTATFQYVMADDGYHTGVLVPVPYVPGTMDIRYAPKWNNNATKLVYSCDSLDLGVRIYLWDVVKYTTVSIGPQVQCNMVEPTWSPDGSSIAYSSNLGDSYHIWVVDSNAAAGPTAGSGGY